MQFQYCTCTNVSFNKNETRRIIIVKEDEPHNLKQMEANYLKYDNCGSTS